MNVHVQFYAQLRDLAGASELNVDLPDKATIGDLLARIYEEMPALRSRDKSRNHKLNPGDEISIMPPVQGG